MSGRLHTKTATLTLLREFSAEPQKLSEWFARGFRTAPDAANAKSAPGSLSDALKKLRTLLEEHQPHEERPAGDQHYHDLLEEIHQAGTISPRELPEAFRETKRSRPLSQEHITQHLFTDNESLARLRKAIGNINTADQNNNAKAMSHEFFSQQLSSFIEESVSEEKTHQDDHSRHIKLSLIR